MVKGIGLKFADEYGELTLCNGMIKTENDVISCTIDIRVPVTLKADEVRRMCEGRLEDENGRIEILGIGDAIILPKRIPTCKCFIQSLHRCNRRYREQADGDRWWNLCKIS